ncbi:MAG: pentapeptide repeat-containing protein [Candidatus Binatia bacterium]
MADDKPDPPDSPAAEPPPTSERKPRSFAGADLSGEDLREAHFSGRDLTATRLRGSNLHGLDLRGARLRDGDLSGADLRDALLDGCDLRSASLAGALASGSSFGAADLTLAHLRGADFRSADLNQALLTDADLSQANFERANLYDADLIGAELGGASFRSAVLCGANLREAHLDGADFAAARFAFTVLAASDLSRARGLETVVHDGPSTVGVDAFLLSRGEIPDAFLSGIGLSPLTIEYLKAVAAAEEGMLVGDALFLLFADVDRARARRLRAYLRMHRHQAWYWQEQAELAGRHNPDLKLRVRFHDRLIVLWSRAAEADVRVRTAIRDGLRKQARERRTVVIAVGCDDFRELPPGVGSLAADFHGTDWDDPRDPLFRRELDRLLARLDLRMIATR